jgi:peptidoglycan/LPS O-acetylase OafA/YrhL
MPALVFMIAVVSLAAAACLKPPPLSEICAALLYAMNYYILAGGEGLPFGTLWSLAVEEHFYLIFPVMVLACLRFRERFLLALLIACVAILFWRILLVYQGAPSDRTYLATDTRIDSILWGCILAVAMDLKVNLEWLTKKSVIGLAVVGLLASLAIRNPAFRETLRYTLQGMCLLPLFVVAIARPPRVAAILESAPMLWIGKRSYSLYLWHFPIIFLIGEQFPHVSPWLTGAVAGMMSLALAAFSYSFVENRYRVKHVNSLAAAAAPAR